MIGVMSSIGQFLAAVDAFCDARGISEARASTLILNGGRRIGEIRSGSSDIGARTLDKAMQWLSDHWPDDKAEWPASVPRPAKADRPEEPAGSSTSPSRGAPEAKCRTVGLSAHRTGRAA